RSQSNESQLVLETVNAITTGKYSCEVSADAPSFHTLIAAAEMEVVVVPARDPIISGIRSRYKVGDIVRGNCTSGHSRPGANITWYINGYETNPVHIKHYKPLKDAREMETVISGIHFVVTPQHFIYGKLKIRCTAHIHDVYWKSTEKSVEENRHATKQSGNVNVVHTFSDDYFDMDDEDNVIDRSDTYMTHIKGDVSSLNASGGSSTLHACLSCFWPRLTTLSLLLYYGVRQQLLQLFFGQKTINEKISNCLAFNGKITRRTKTTTATAMGASRTATATTTSTTTTIMANNENCNKLNKENTGQQRRHKMETKELQQQRQREQQKQQHKMPSDEQQLQYVQHPESMQQQQQQRPAAISGPMFSEVATICYKDTKAGEEEDKEDGDQKQQQQQPRQVSVQLAQQHQNYYNVQHQVACNGTTSVNETYNLTMTIQVATIFNTGNRSRTTTHSNNANILPQHRAAAIPTDVIWQLCHKQSLAIKHNLFILQQQQQHCNYLSYPTKYQEIQKNNPLTINLSTTTKSINSIFATSNEFNVTNFSQLTNVVGCLQTKLMLDTTTPKFYIMHT
uniref:CD80-like immunoglobulin C2-set domain-containing protein n=1 Tax=Musca domestica TaxID=7370 RepID=A0A1I8MXF4_MUSDO